MKRALVMLVAVLAVACGGGKAKTADPSAATCCCTASEGREVVADTVCEERGGTCDPAETCESDDPDEGSGADGDSDRDDY